MDTGETHQNDSTKMLPLVECLTQDSQRVELDLYIPEDLIFFDGHFDSMPILPGFVTLQWALLLGQQYFTKRLAIREINALKFLKSLTPQQHYRLRLDFAPLTNVLNFEYTDLLNQRHVLGRIRCEELQ